jgi:hypothetical protein
VEIFTTSPAIPTSIGHLLLGDFQEDNITTDEVAGYALQTKTDPHPKCSKYSKYTQINPG